MSKRFIICLMIIMSVFLSSCSSKSDVTNIPQDDSEESAQVTVQEESYRKTDFYENVDIVIDKETDMATYKDDTITYSWNVETYRYEFYNARPSLPVTVNDITYHFIVFDVTNGIPSDLDDYAVNCGYNYFCSDISGYVCAGHPYGVNEKGYMYSECTIYYGNKDENKTDTEILRIFAFTNGEKAAAIGVAVEGEHEKLKKLYEDNYAESKDNGLIEKEVKAIIDSFEFIE